MITGEIAVGSIMDRQAELARWRERSRRDAEWYALKEWWRAERAVRRARGSSQRQAALAEQRRVGWLYRAELARAWPKWQRAHGKT